MNRTRYHNAPSTSHEATTERPTSAVQRARRRPPRCWRDRPPADPAPLIPKGSTQAHRSAQTRTLLFSDLEGSTRLLQSLGETYAAVLRMQRRLLRQAIQQRGGRVVDMTGDGCFAVFDTAVDAVAAAVAAQRALAAHPWPGAAAVRARMGLHTGEPMRFGTTYVGLDVHHAARLCAAGHGSQILISQTTRAQIERVLPPEMRLVSLGLHCLKDLDPPETISQLLAPGLTAHFPPLRTPAAQTTAQDRRDIEQRETGQDPAFQNHVRPITGRAA